MLANDREHFIKLVNQSLTRHFHLIQELVKRGSYFFDYGNSFMKAIFDAGNSDIAKNGKDTTEGFIFPSYVEDIMGPMLFDYGYGPPLPGSGQLGLDPRRRQEQAGGGNPVPHSLSGCTGPQRHRPQVQ